MLSLVCLFILHTSTCVPFSVNAAGNEHACLTRSIPSSSSSMHIYSYYLSVSSVDKARAEAAESSRSCRCRVPCYGGLWWHVAAAESSLAVRTGAISGAGWRRRRNATNPAAVCRPANHHSTDYTAKWRHCMPDPTTLPTDDTQGETPTIHPSTGSRVLRFTGWSIGRPWTWHVRLRGYIYSCWLARGWLAHCTRPSLPPIHRMFWLSRTHARMVGATPRARHGRTTYGST